MKDFLTAIAYQEYKKYRNVAYESLVEAIKFYNDINKTNFEPKSEASKFFELLGGGCNNPLYRNK